MTRRRTSSVSGQFRCLVLDTNVKLKSSGLYYIPLDSQLRFTLSTSLIPYDVKLFCDYHSTNFQRGVYYELKWSSNDEDRFAQIFCTRSGPIHYYFIAKDKKGEGYIIVEPRLSNLPTGDSDETMCLTFLSKSLGKLEDWESRLAIAYHTGYNMIHLTPIQQLYKVSNSSYSITNHHQLNPLFGKDKTHNDIKKIVDKMASEWNILSITDLVYNHAANDCEILEKHPEASYNLINSPHLKPAFLLDSILMQFTRDIHEEKIEKIPSKIEKIHLSIIKDYLLNEVLPLYAFHEFFMIDVKKTINEFTQLIENKLPTTLIHNYEDEYTLRIEYKTYNRFDGRIDLEKAQEIFYCADRTSIEACQLLTDRLIYLNHLKQAQIESDLSLAIENCIKGCEFHFFDSYGPKFEKISLRTPFVGNYFAYPNEKLFETNPNEIEQAYKDNNKLFLERVMAHNGWVMNDNPLRNFAEDTQGPNVYFRRELNQWSDIVKLNFGNCETDSPYLWAYMKEYTRLIATTFHGARLDNCHSTPLHVAQYLMDYARELNPNFYILGELFTNSETLDHLFINKLGINALVRESIHAQLPYDLGHMICNHSRLAVGSLFRLQTTFRPRCAQAFLYDQTHDNPCAIERRSLCDVLPRSAYVSMSCTPTGSNRGYDELVPHHIDVVHERRTYEKWTDDKMNGFIQAKLILNRFHARLSTEGYTRMIADQLSLNTLMISRQHPILNSTIILIGHTDTVKIIDEEKIEPLLIQGTVENILFEMNVSWLNNENKIDLFIRDVDHINGLRDKDIHIYINENLKKDESNFVKIIQDNENKMTKIIFNKDKFLPGSIIAFQINLLTNAKQASNQLKKEIFENDLSTFRSLISKISLTDLNYILYRCKTEENNEIYFIPGYTSLVYAGLQGIESILIQMRSLTTEQMIKHPLCIHLKQGNWLMLYIIQRLIDNKRTIFIGQWFEKYFQFIEQLPRYLIPVYFDLLIHRTYNICIERAIELMPTKFIQQGSKFIKALAMTSVQMMGLVSNARLPNYEDSKQENDWPSMAAGLPNFAEGIWRNWGRDTFISLRGLLLLTGRFEDARHLILTYGSCLRHGLIPNLLAGPRYNARDAIWFWLYSISQYTQLVPNGSQILSENIQGKCLHSIIKTTINTHLNGLSFREYNAGYQLDRVMSDEGFNNKIGVDSKTGFIFGGNRWNCGTWMDKMGSSEYAGNKGYPASSRDGSAIELIGLSRAVIYWLIQMIENDFYPYKEHKQIFQNWLNKIDENFEKEFWIDENNQNQFINRRNIYKDTINSSLQWTDYQFRPNFLIAAVIAPEMFNKDHIWLALSQVESLLLGPLGIKTLDPSDQQYIGDYDNKNESNDFKCAHGYNYHNGPEWIWITGYYLRAKLYWSPKDKLKQTIEHIEEVLTKHRDIINTSEWKSLPELTSSNGLFCSDSCPAQAWSSATILEVLYDLQQFY